MKNKPKPPKSKRGEIYRFIMGLKVNLFSPQLIVKEGEINIKRLATDERQIISFIMAQLEALHDFHTSRAETRILEMILEFAEGAAALLLKKIDASLVKEKNADPFGFRRISINEVQVVAKSRQLSQEANFLHPRLLLPIKYREAVERVKKRIKADV